MHAANVKIRARGRVTDRQWIPGHRSLRENDVLSSDLPK
jgi:hypothetical protein